jgi:hypothetical protein
MKDRPLEDKPACSVKSAPFPTEVICTKCGAGLEVWSDESHITCISCGCAVNNNGDV